MVNKFYIMKKEVIIVKAEEGSASVNHSLNSRDIIVSVYINSDMAQDLVPQAKISVRNNNFFFISNVGNVELKVVIIG